MARAFFDTANKFSPEDIEALIALQMKVNPDGTVPEFGAPNQETWLIREETTNRIVGFIHFEHLMEIRAMVTDPDYEHKKMALTIGHAALETCLRRLGHVQYYISVPKHHEHVRKFYDEEGARVDKDSVRYRKRL